MRFALNAAEADRLASFMERLRQRMDIEADDAELWEEYVQRSFTKGLGRSYDQVKRLASTEDGKGQFLRTALTRPVAADKIKLLVQRPIEKFKGFNAQSAATAVDIMADGLAQGLNPVQIAKQIKNALGISLRKAEALARTEIVRAHAEGQLLAFEELGVEDLGVAVEWSTAGDERVCKMCKPLEGVVFKLSELKNRGLLPRHPGCRCAYLPANVGEDDEQKRSKKQIDKAIRSSLKFGDWSVQLPKIGKKRPQPLAASKA